MGRVSEQKLHLAHSHGMLCERITEVQLGLGLGLGLMVKSWHSGLLALRPLGTPAFWHSGLLALRPALGTLASWHSRLLALSLVKLSGPLQFLA